MKRIKNNVNLCVAHDHDRKQTQTGIGKGTKHSNYFK